MMKESSQEKPIISPNEALRRVQVIRKLLDETALLINSNGLFPSTNSQAKNELESFPHQELVITAQNLGTIFIEVCVVI